MKTIIVAVFLCLSVSLSLAQFNIGDSVAVAMGSNGLNVRSAPSVNSTVLKVERDGAAGRIVGGPQSDPAYIFYQIVYFDGITGWSAGKYLVRVVPVVPPPVNPCPISKADSLRIFALGMASVHATNDTSRIDSLVIRIQGFRNIRVLDDSTVVVK
jgi:hypothetical protein